MPTKHFHYENRTKPLLSRKAFIWRVVYNFLAVQVAVVVALSLGILGYHFLGELSWLDSLLNASMILGGMGPVDALHTPASKIFASFYALFSGVFFIGAATTLIAPFAHRLIHRFHLEN